MISIIVPTLNEAENIAPLLKSIKEALKKNKLVYEVIFVDDHSTDETQRNILAHKKNHPIKLFLKQGAPGKAQSLLEGFSQASYDILCMIDADLQYPPEAIPAMAQKIISGKADIVVANRKKHKTGVLRKLFSNSFRTIFGKWLHNLECDVQSGLKVFDRDILNRYSIKPGPWTFDLEFLTKAQKAGYRIVSHDITFNPRNAGEAKVNLFSSTVQIGWNAIKLKWIQYPYMPFTKKQVGLMGQGFHYNGKKYVTHTSLNYKDTSLKRLNGLQKASLLFLIILLGISLWTNWLITVQWFLGILTLFYLLDMFFNLYLVYRSLNNSPEIQVARSEIENYTKIWPKYTIFCPLYKEAHVLPQFTKAIEKLDYPEDKLEVMLLLEEDDKATIKAAEKMNLPKCFTIVVVPDANPKTKPKACNYGLQQATGEFAVIYDAEDVPDTDQLKKAVLAFEALGEEYICIQAKLNYYNPTQNLLTRLFTLEYSLWFGLILPGLQSINAPIPLGGTSNHFRTNQLRALEGWDPFNVTEDADLGMRIVKRGFLTAVMDSYTMEEANSQPWNWIRQRSRWIKGYMQTYLVHMRQPASMWKQWNRPHLLTFQLTVGGKILSMLVNPLLWITTLSYFLFRETMDPILNTILLPWVFYLGMVSLVFGNFFYFYNYMIAAAQQKRWNLVKFGYLIPAYWLMMSFAAIFALYELIVRPHHWQKTVHGLHLTKKKKDKKPNFFQKQSFSAPRLNLSFIRNS